MPTFAITRNNAHNLSFVRADNEAAAVLVHDLNCLLTNCYFGENSNGARPATWDEARDASILALDQFKVELSSTDDLTTPNDRTFCVTLKSFSGTQSDLLISAKTKTEAALVARLYALSSGHLRNAQSIAIGEATVETASYDKVAFAKAVVGASGRTALYSRRNFSVTSA